jgi:hypothetical protein
MSSMELHDNSYETIPDYFYDNQVLEVMDHGKGPKKRQFIFLGKEKTWQVTI